MVGADLVGDGTIDLDLYAEEDEQADEQEGQHADAGYDEDDQQPEASEPLPSLQVTDD
jgi:hypothetical protein